MQRPRGVSSTSQQRGQPGKTATPALQTQSAGARASTCLGRPLRCTTRVEAAERETWCQLSANGCGLMFQAGKSSLEGGLGSCLALSLPCAGCTRGDGGATWSVPLLEPACVSERLVYQLCRLAWACIGRPARCAGCADAAHAVSRCVTRRKVGSVTRPPCTTAAKASCRASSRLWAPQALHRLRAQRRAARRRARAEAQRRSSRACRAAVGGKEERNFESE